jgi:tRNA 2-thiouridine synthesizing protein E
MTKALLGGQQIEVDEDGFIQEPEKWNKEVAEALAATEEASPMGEDHWKLINYVRVYYLKYEVSPPLPVLMKKTGIDLKKIPRGPARVCKVAGLPRPTGCF